MKAIGVIEVKGMVPAYDGIDVMLKAGCVRLEGISIIGAGIVTVIISGELSHVEEAIQLGADAVRACHVAHVDELVIPSPGRASEKLLGMIGFHDQ